MSDELNVLYRLAGRRTPAEHGLDVATVPPGTREVMLEMILIEIEGMAVREEHTQEDWEILLRSCNPRVRMLGLRLAGQRSTGDRRGRDRPGAPGVHD
jgi:hypothetical protein